MPNHAAVASLRTLSASPVCKKMDSLGFICGWIASFMDLLFQVNRITRIALQVDGQATSPVAVGRGAGVWAGRSVLMLCLS